MPTDLYFPGTKWGSRSGADEYGTFWSAVMPPAPLNGTQLVLNPNFSNYSGTPDDRVNDSFTSWTVAASGSNCVEASIATYRTAPSSCRQICINVSGAAIQQSFTGISPLEEYLLQWSMYPEKQATGNQYRCRVIGVVGSTATRYCGSLGDWYDSNVGNDSSGLTIATWNSRSKNFVTEEGMDRLAIVLQPLQSADGTGIFYLDDVDMRAVGNGGTRANTCYTMNNEWAARVLENTVRVRGLSGVGTTNSSGTLAVTFPRSDYFKYIPIIRVYRPSMLPERGYTQYQFPDELRQNGWLFPLDGRTMRYSQTDNIWYALSPTSNDYAISINGTTGFTVVCESGNVPFYWHAYGI